MPVKKQKNFLRGKIILITGGARSGKSAFALSLGKSAKKPCYIATASPFDQEMKERIALHRQQRNKHWITIEETLYLANAITEAKKQFSDFILIDCLTLWLSNVFFQKLDWETELDDFVTFLQTHKSTLPPIVMVSNEVGCGIVPANKLARRFRDAAGITNQSIAKIADEVYFCTCGIPVLISKKL